MDFSRDFLNIFVFTLLYFKIRSDFLIQRMLSRNSADHQRVDLHVGRWSGRRIRVKQNFLVILTVLELPIRPFHDREPREAIGPILGTLTMVHMEVHIKDIERETC